ncbi:MAG: hypothetical protein MUD01_27615 [Chloroflexaceae bacterium]|jgi:hypothetical protein|nr:hypothetical protein [Chloroflexaceae bacterium]
MKHTTSVVELAPLDYRAALDAAMVRVRCKPDIALQSNIPQLLDEVRWRLPRPVECDAATSLLWIEPLAGSWPTELQRLTQALPVGGLLAVVASQPLARLLPERQRWDGRGLGLRPGGLGKLRQSLVRNGFRLEPTCHFHSFASIAVQALGQLAARSGKAALADRLHFAARLRYSGSSVLHRPATVALLVGHKEHKP